MKIFVIIYISFFLTTMTSAESFATQNLIFKKIQKNPNKWHEKLVAFEGIVTDIEKDHLNRPYLKIRMPKPIYKDLWIANLFNHRPEIKKNDIIRVLGYYTSVEKDIPMKKINKDGYHLISFCTLSITTESTYFFPPAINQCKDWQNGKLQLSSDD